MIYLHAYKQERPRGGDASQYAGREGRRIQTYAVQTLCLPVVTMNTVRTMSFSCLHHAHP